MSATLLTPAAVLVLAPELALLPGVVDGGGGPTVPYIEIVDIAGVLLDAATWGVQLSSAHWTLAAHMTAMRFDTSLAAGAVTSRKIDKIQENYAAPGNDAMGDLRLTSYGKTHLMLRDRLPALSSFSTVERGWTLPEGRVI